MTGIVTGWRKSTASMSNGQCVEVASWRKSSHSAGAGECVEAASGEDLVLVRDSTEEGSGPVLAFGTGAWRAFAASLKSPGFTGLR